MNWKIFFININFYVWKISSSPGYLTLRFFVDIKRRCLEFLLNFYVRKISSSPGHLTVCFFIDIKRRYLVGVIRIQAKV